MLNHIVLMGRLTRDPELRYAGEVPVCSFTLAVDRDFKSSGQPETDSIDVVTWRNTATFSSSPAWTSWTARAGPGPSRRNTTCPS